MRIILSAMMASALHEACAAGSVTAVKPLLRSGSANKAALKIAIEHGHANVVALLLEQTGTAVTPELVAWAAYWCPSFGPRLDYHAFRRRRYAERNAKPLHICTPTDPGHQHNAVLKLLLAHASIQPFLRMNDEWNVLLDVAIAGNLDMVDFILRATPIDPAAYFNGAVYYAAVNGHVDVLKRLLADKRVDPTTDFGSDDKNAPLREAKDPAIQELLLADPRVLAAFETGSPSTPTTDVVLSFDIGTRHLSYAIVSGAKALLHWALVDLATTKVGVALERMYTHLTAMWSTWKDSVTHVVLETQMAPKMKSIFHALQMFFLCHGVAADHIIAFSAAHKLTVDNELLDGESELTEAEVHLWSRVLKRKDTYGLRKDIGVLHALRLVKNMPNASEWTRQLLQWYEDDKADDLADALLQGIAFLERRRRQTKKTIRSEKKTPVGRLVPASRRRGQQKRPAS